MNENKRSVDMTKADSSETQKKKRRRITTLFYNNNFVVIVAILISIVCWVLLTLNDARSSTTKTFTDVPIIIDTEAIEENSGLHMIAILDPKNFTDKKADVTVTGSIFQLSKVTAENVSVTAQVSNVTKAGEYILTLTPTCSVNNVNVSLGDDSSFIKVWFDRYQEKNITIDKVIASGVSTSSEDLIVGDSYSSIKSLIISGPESVIEQIDSVLVCAQVDKELSQTENFYGTINYVDAQGGVLADNLTSYINILDYNDIGADSESYAGAPASSDVTVTVPIRKTLTLPLAIDIKNAPEGFDVASLKYSISPKTVTLEGDIDAINKLSEINEYKVDAIDITTLSPENHKYALKLNLSTGIEELNAVSDVVVDFDLSGYSAVNITLENKGKFSLVNADGIKASIKSETLDAIVIGPSSVVNRLGSKDFSVTVDMGSFDGTAGQRKLEAKVSVVGKSNCWVIGTYTVAVSVW